MPSKQRIKSTRKPKPEPEPERTEEAEPVRSDAREHEVEHAAPERIPESDVEPSDDDLEPSAPDRGWEVHPDDVEW